MSGSYGQLNAKYNTLYALYLQLANNPPVGSPDLQAVLDEGASASNKTITLTDNNVIPNSIEITPTNIVINNDAGSVGYVLTKNADNNIEWAEGGGGGTQDIQSVLDEGNTATDIAILFNQTANPAINSGMNSQSIALNSNNLTSTNQRSLTLNTAEVEMLNYPGQQETAQTIIDTTQFKLKFTAGRIDPKPSPEAIYGLNKMSLNDGALNNDNKTIEVEPTGITISEFDNSVLTNEIIIDNEGFSVENITTGKVAYINLTAGLSLPPSSAITLENTAGANGYVITSNGTTASWQPSSGGGSWNGTATSDLNMGTYDITSSNGTLNLNATDIDITGQVTFNLPPHSSSPAVLGNDLVNKGYVDSLVGQYSGGFNLFLNYSQTSGAFPTYKVLAQTISSAVGQQVDITGFTSGTQEVARFITEPLGITELPAGLWDAFVYGSVSGTGGDVHYSFQLNKVTSAGVSTPIATSGISPDVNASPNNNPTSYSMIAPITAPVTLALTDRVAFILSVTKTGGGEVTLRTFFEGSYYSFVQSTLNAGTTLLSSNNNWTGTNNFSINPTTPSKTSPANTDIINYADIQRLSTPIVSTLDYYITTDSPFFQYPPAPPTNTLLNTYQYYGWYFINSVIGRNFSWYFAPDYAMTVADVKGLYMNYFNITTTSNDNCPFISIYTKPTGTNDVIPFFAHSVNTFVPTFTPIATTPFCSFMNISGTQQDPFPYGHILGSMAQSTVNNPRGEYLPTEEVLAVAVGSNSGSPLNQVAFIMSKVGICLEQGNQELILNPQNIIVPPNLTQTLTSGNSAGNLSITGVNNLSATSITTPTLANGSATLTVGTVGQITNIVGTLQNNGAELPAYISSAGVASGSIDMNSNSITECNSLDSVSSLTLGGTNALGVNVGRSAQTTDLLGNVRLNGSSGTSGQVLTSTGSTTAPTFQALPTPYISSGGVASGSIDMNSNSITECNSLDSVSALTLGGTNALGTTLGRLNQTTNLVGNVQINGSSGTSGQVLTSTGSTTAPTFQPLTIALTPNVQNNITGNAISMAIGLLAIRSLNITIVSGGKYLINAGCSTFSSGGTLQNSTFMLINVGQSAQTASPSPVDSVPITTNTGFMNAPLFDESNCMACVKFNNLAGEKYTLSNSYVWTAPASSAGARTVSLFARASGTITGAVVVSNYVLSVTRIA